MTNLKLILYVIIVLTSLCTAIPVQAILTDDEIINHAKETSVSSLEAGLPDKAFEKWLSETFGPKWEINWEIVGCEQLGMPETDRDDVCVLVSTRSYYKYTIDKISKTSLYRIEIKLSVENRQKGWHKKPSILYVVSFEDHFFDSGNKYPTYTKALFKLSKIKPLLDSYEEKIKDLKATKRRLRRQDILGKIIFLCSWGIIFVGPILSFILLMRKLRKGLIQIKVALFKLFCYSLVSFFLSIGIMYGVDFFERYFFKTEGFLHGEFSFIIIFLDILSKFGAWLILNIILFVSMILIDRKK